MWMLSRKEEDLAADRKRQRQRGGRGEGGGGGPGESSSSLGGTRLSSSQDGRMEEEWLSPIFHASKNCFLNIDFKDKSIGFWSVILLNL